MSGGLFVGLENAMMTGFTAIVSVQSAVYSTMVAGLAVSAMTIYIIMQGYKTLAGKLETPLADVAWDTARMSLILTFSLNADGYLDATFSAINSLKEGFSGSQSVWALLDSAWEKGQEIGTALWRLDDDTFSIKGVLAEYTVWGGVGFMLVVSALVNLIAELTLMLMMATAPIFIFCLMFGWLRPMFNNWAQTIFTVLLTVLFSSLALRVAMEYLEKTLDSASQQASSANIATLAVQCCVASICSGVVVLFSAKLAGALAGASVQGSIQGIASGKGMLAGKMGMKAAAPVVSGARGAAGRAGEQATKNLSAGRDMAKQSRSAVENMKRANK